VHRQELDGLPVVRYIDAGAVAHAALAPDVEYLDIRLAPLMGEYLSHTALSRRGLR
jgi:hypothetical protein